MFKNKKGFTIVELVIVIAVIAILASVLIPTFSGIVTKANTSAALQSATSAMKSTLAMSEYGTISDGTQFVIVGAEKPSYVFKFEKNAIQTDKFDASGNVTPMTDWNSVIVKGTTSGNSTTVSETDFNMIKVALSGVANMGTVNYADYTVTDKGGYIVLKLTADNTYLQPNATNGAENTALKFFVNTDYPTDLVTITKSN